MVTDIECGRQTYIQQFRVHKNKDRSRIGDGYLDRTGHMYGHDFYSLHLSILGSYHKMEDNEG